MIYVLQHQHADLCSIRHVSCEESETHWDIFRLEMLQLRPVDMLFYSEAIDEVVAHGVFAHDPVCTGMGKGDSEKAAICGHVQRPTWTLVHDLSFEGSGDTFAGHEFMNSCSIRCQDYLCSSLGTRWKRCVVGSIEYGVHIRLGVSRERESDLRHRGQIGAVSTDLSSDLSARSGGAGIRRSGCRRAVNA